MIDLGSKPMPTSDLNAPAFSSSDEASSRSGSSVSKRNVAAHHRFVADRMWTAMTSSKLRAARLDGAAPVPVVQLPSGLARCVLSRRHGHAEDLGRDGERGQDVVAVQLGELGDADLSRGARRRRRTPSAPGRAASSGPSWDRTPRCARPAGRRGTRPRPAPAPGPHHARHPTAGGEHVGGVLGHQVGQGHLAEHRLHHADPDVVALGVLGGGVGEGHDLVRLERHRAAAAGRSRGPSRAARWCACRSYGHNRDGRDAVDGRDRSDRAGWSRGTRTSSPPCPCG